jgi:hypothetical protein
MDSGGSATLQFPIRFGDIIFAKAHTAIVHAKTAARAKAIGGWP